MSALKIVVGPNGIRTPVIGPRIVVGPAGVKAPVVASGTKGDVTGHEFHGNQWTGEAAARAAEPPSTGPFYHGTNAVLKPGTMLSPADSPQRDYTYYDPTKVYLTDAHHLAERYAVGRAGREGGEPHTYEIEPVGKVERDTEYIATGWGKDQHMAPAARVVREVPLPGFVHWADGRMMRGPGTKGDVAGHEFHGNQWTGGRSGGDLPKVTSLDEAIQRLSNHQGVMFERPSEAVALLDKLAAIAKDAKAKGEKAPLYNLCDVHVSGSNLFCNDNVGISRSQMPQLSGTPRPGSPADALPRNQFGQVDVTPMFRQYLAGQGVQISRTTEDASKLRASQDELNGTEVAALMKVKEAGGLIETPTLISKDNYIVDGHHRWAAEVGAEYDEGKPVPMTVDRVNMPILQLLKEANTYATKMGLPQADVAHNQVFTPTKDGHWAVKYSPDQERDDHGRFGSGGGGHEDAIHLIERVRRAGGATVSPITAASPTTGYMVGLKGFTSINPDSLSDDQLADKLVGYVDQHQAQWDDPANHIGLWHDTDHHEVVFDVSKLVADRAEAITLGQQQDQQTIYGNEHGEIIEIGGTGQREGGG